MKKRAVCFLGNNGNWWVYGSLITNKYEEHYVELFMTKEFLELIEDEKNKSNIIFSILDIDKASKKRHKRPPKGSRPSKLPL